MVSGYIGSMDGFQREKGVLWMVLGKNRFSYISFAFPYYAFNFCCLLVVFPCFAELLTLKGNCIMGMKICWVSREFVYRWNAIIKIDRICMRRRWQPIHSSRIGECNMTPQIHWFFLSVKHTTGDFALKRDATRTILVFNIPCVPLPPKYFLRFRKLSETEWHVHWRTAIAVRGYHYICLFK